MIRLNDRDLTFTLYYLCYIYIIYLSTYYSHNFFKSYFSKMHLIFFKETNESDPITFTIPHPHSSTNTKNIHTLQCILSRRITYASFKNNKKVTSASQQNRVTRLRIIHLPEITKKWCNKCVWKQLFSDTVHQAVQDNGPWETGNKPSFQATA